MKRLKSNKHILHVLKNANPKVRKAILLSVDDEVIKTLLECVLNTLNGNHIVSKNTKSKLSKYKLCLRKLSSVKYSLKHKRKILLQKGGGFLGLLLSSVLSGVIGKLISG